jgi:hypothetical protein
MPEADILEICESDGVFYEGESEKLMFLAI